MQELIGKTVTKLLINQTKTVLKFETDGGAVAYYVDGDCCSESWFSDITGVECLLGQKVLTSELVICDEIDDDDGWSFQDEDKIYCIKLITAKGHIDIIFRNSSNGWIELCEFLIAGLSPSLLEKVRQYLWENDPMFNAKERIAYRNMRLDGDA